MSAAEADILRRARARISDPSRWTQEFYARDRAGYRTDPTSSDAVRWCSYGAVDAELGTSQVDQFLHLAARVLGLHSPGSANDNGDHATVLRMFDRAIELAEADQ
jgi:hypothetical protein